MKHLNIFFAKMQNVNKQTKTFTLQNYSEKQMEFLPSDVMREKNDFRKRGKRAGPPLLFHIYFNTFLVLRPEIDFK